MGTHKAFTPAPKSPAKFAHPGHVTADAQLRVQAQSPTAITADEETGVHRTDRRDVRYELPERWDGLS